MGNLIIQHFSTPAQAAGPAAVPADFSSRNLAGGAQPSLAPTQIPGVRALEGVLSAW